MIWKVFGTKLDHSRNTKQQNDNVIFCSQKEKPEEKDDEKKEEEEKTDEKDTEEKKEKTEEKKEKDEKKEDGEKKEESKVMFYGIFLTLNISFHTKCSKHRAQG